MTFAIIIVVIIYVAATTGLGIYGHIGNLRTLARTIFLLVGLSHGFTWC